MRVDLSLDLPEPRSLPELREHLIQLRAAAEIVASQSVDRKGEMDPNDPIFFRISALEIRAPELPIETPAEIGAGLDVLREMIEPDGWQYSDRRDARLFEAIRDGVGGLNRARQKPGAAATGEWLHPIALRDTLDEVIHSLALVSEVLQSRYRANGGANERAADGGTCRLVDDQIEKVREVRDALR
jgi:hypothetical protein